MTSSTHLRSDKPTPIARARRRRLIGAAALLSLIAGCLPASAQTWPAKPIKWVVPFPPGGLVDNVSRAVALRLADRLGQPVVIENRPGANGGIGSAYVAKSAPDGYTLLSGSTGTHAINPHLYSNLPYDALKDFVPISGLADYDLALVVNAQSRIMSLADLLAASKAKTGGLSYGSSGPGSSNHMVSELLGVLTAARFVHVPYKGDGPALVDLMGNQLDFMFTPVSLALQHEKSGKLRMIATTGAKRNAGSPQVPAAVETVPSMEFSGWIGAFAPAGTPREIVSRLAAEMTAVLNLPEMKPAFDGINSAASTPDAFAQRVRRDNIVWEDVVRKSGARP